MLLIGLLLVLAAAAAGVAVVYDGAETTKVEFFGHTATMSVSAIFFAGVATMLVFMLGLWMMQGSIGRARRRRLARREARVEHRDSVRSLEEEKAQLAEENARLERQLQRDRAAAGTSGAAVGGTSAAATSATPARDADGDGVPDRAERGGLFSRNRDHDREGIADDREDAFGGNHRAEPPAR
jgi:ABC-type nickel/cobalt efflux system permease component RcnA